MRVICVISLLSLCLSTITAAPAGSDVISRQEDEHEHHGHDHHHMPQGDDDAIRPPETASSIDQASSISTPALSTVPHPPEPDHHSHGSHAAPKAVLDDESIHYWHHFPPSYLAADFKLDKDSAIFGEEFDDEWDPQRASGHKSLMLGHVLAMIGAYFGALPICKSSLESYIACLIAHNVDSFGFTSRTSLGSRLCEYSLPGASPGRMASWCRIPSVKS